MNRVMQPDLSDIDLPSVCDLRTAQRLLDWMQEHPEFNRIVMKYTYDAELDLQLYYENEENVGRNLRQLLRDALAQENRPVCIGGFTRANDLVLVDYQVR